MSISPKSSVGEKQIFCNSCKLCVALTELGLLCFYSLLQMLCSAAATLISKHRFNGLQSLFIIKYRINGLQPLFIIIRRFKGLQRLEGLGMLKQTNIFQRKRRLCDKSYTPAFFFCVILHCKNKTT